MIFGFSSNRSDSVEISLWKFVWGHLFTVIDVFFNLTKLVRWQPVDDPLVLDLDGDGIETVSQSQSGVHFDMDGDYFAEASGWVSSDDGFLVIDKSRGEESGHAVSAPDREIIPRAAQGIYPQPERISDANRAAKGLNAANDNKIEIPTGRAA